MRAMCPLYVAGLIGPGERKSVQPMASGSACEPRPPAPLRLGRRLGRRPARGGAPGPGRRARGRAGRVPRDRRHGAAEEGHASVGVAPQYASALGKNANCQTLVSLTLARARCPCPWRCGCSCPRRGRATPRAWPGPACPPSTAPPGPSPRSPSRSSTASWPRACASAACWPTRATGSAPPSARRSQPRAQLGGRHPAHPEGLPGRRGDGARRGARPPASGPRAEPRRSSAEALLEGEAWRLTWRRGTKGALSGRVRGARVRVADGPAVRIRARQPAYAGRGSLARGRATWNSPTWWTGSGPLSSASGEPGLVRLAAPRWLESVAGSDYAASSAASRHAAKASARNWRWVAAEIR